MDSKKEVTKNAPHRPMLYEFANQDCKLCRGNGLRHTPILQPRAPGRNDPCLCGSGKKYKHCCWETYKDFGRRGSLQYCKCVSMKAYEEAISDWKIAMEVFQCQCTDSDVNADKKNEDDSN